MADTETEYPYPKPIDVERQMSENIRRKDAEREAAAGENPALRFRSRGREEKKIWVFPARADQPIPLLGGGYIGREGAEVLLNDVFINRRLRDGSLVVGQQPVAAAETPVVETVVEEPQEVTVAEQSPEPEPEPRRRRARSE